MEPEDRGVGMVFQDYALFPHLTVAQNIAFRLDCRSVLTARRLHWHSSLPHLVKYMVHAKMCENWGYEKLYKAIEKKDVDEMHHAEWLIERILFLEGTPNVSNAPEIIDNDLEAELMAVPAYNAAIALAHEVSD